jgi:hypothetical protein
MCEGQCLTRLSSANCNISVLFWLIVHTMASHFTQLNTRTQNVTFSDLVKRQISELKISGQMHEDEAIITWADIHDGRCFFSLILT